MSGHDSKTKRILKTREKLLSAFEGYAFCAQDWNPRNEEDFEDLVNAVDEILETEIK